MRAASCGCKTGNYRFDTAPERRLGEGPHFSEIFATPCRHCDKVIIRILYEVEGISRSGRWYCGVVDAETARQIDSGDILELFARLPRYWYGGSYFAGRVGTASGPLTL